MEASNPPSGEGTAPAAQDATPTEPDLSNTVATITPDAISPTASEKESDLDLSNKATETHILQTTSDLNEIKDEDEKKPRNLQTHPIDTAFWLTGLVPNNKPVEEMKTMDTNVLGIRFAEILADIEQWTEKFCELPKQAFSQQRQYFESNILRFENREFCTKEYLIVVLDGNEDPLHLLRAYVARYVLSNTFEQSNAVFANDGSEKSIDWPNGPPPPGIKKTLDWLIETSQLLDGPSPATLRQAIYGGMMMTEKELSFLSSSKEKNAKSDDQSKLRIAFMEKCKTAAKLISEKLIEAVFSPSVTKILSAEGYRQRSLELTEIIIKALCLATMVSTWTNTEGRVWGEVRFKWYGAAQGSTSQDGLLDPGKVSLCQQKPPQPAWSKGQTQVVLLATPLIEFRFDMSGSVYTVRRAEACTISPESQQAQKLKLEDYERKEQEARVAKQKRKDDQSKARKEAMNASIAAAKADTTAKANVTRKRNAENPNMARPKKPRKDKSTQPSEEAAPAAAPVKTARNGRAGAKSKVGVPKETMIIKTEEPTGQ